jgi:hypothetical protein
LKIWHDLSLDHTELPKDKNSTDSLNKYHFVDLLEYSIPGHSFAITQDEIVRAEVNESLRKLAGGVNSELRRTRGRRRQEMESRTKLFHVLDGQTVSVEDLKNENKVIYDQLNE